MDLKNYKPTNYTIKIWSSKKTFEKATIIYQNNTQSTKKINVATVRLIYKEDRTRYTWKWVWSKMNYTNKNQGWELYRRTKDLEDIGVKRKGWILFINTKLVQRKGMKSAIPEMRKSILANTWIMVFILRSNNVYLEF